MRVAVLVLILGLVSGVASGQAIWPAKKVSVTGTTATTLQGLIDSGEIPQARVATTCSTQNGGAPNEICRQTSDTPNTLWVCSVTSPSVCNAASWVAAGGSGSGSAAFSAITGATNTTAAMVVGTGASISTSGSGAITATAMPLTKLTNDAGCTSLQVVRLNSGATAYECATGGGVNSITSSNCTTASGVVTDLCRDTGTDHGQTLWQCPNATCPATAWQQVTPPSAVTSKTTDYVIPDTGALNRVYTNSGAAGAVVFTLPTCKAGTFYNFVEIAAFPVKVLPPTGKWIRSPGLSAPSSSGQGVQQDGTVLYSRMSVRGLCITGAEWLVESTEGGEWLPY